MSFQGLTPEALVKRNDSKNPATTCKGLTTSGRPCRRSLGSTPSSSPAPSPGTSPAKSGDDVGVVAVLNEGDAAAYFCWQHKDQAENLIAKMRHERQKTKIMPLQKRSSIDTLAEKVGVVDLDADAEQKHGIRRRKVKKRDTLPAEWQSIKGPLMSVPEDVVRESLEGARPPQRRPSPKKERQGRSNVRASWSCCIRADDDYNDDGPPARRGERYDPHQHRRPSQTRPVALHNAQRRPQMQERPQRHSSSSPRRPLSHSPRQSQQLTPTNPSRPSLSTSPPHFQTQNFLSLIPSHLDPTTTSALLFELSKPFAKDDEAGYIYIFWLTPESQRSVPDDDIASTILDGDLDYQDISDFSPRNPSSSRSRQPSRARDRDVALNRYASTKGETHAPPKILLKIGRAQNVHRRMTQWTKQCNQNITLVRYYPYYASQAADPRSPSGAKVPHVNRVERLIHIELRGMGMGKEKEKCFECGREHREWFDVTATKEGLKGVDQVVRRWVGWAEALEK